MRKLLAILLLALPMYAQNGSTSSFRRVYSLPVTCSVSQTVWLMGTGSYECSAANTWTRIGGSGGGGGSWGSITGTLSAQSDLNTALNGKVPTTRTVNGFALSSNVTLAASDVGALANTTVLPANTTATSNQWFTAYNSTTGAFTKAQPGFSNLSGNINVSQMNSGTSASSSTFWRGDGTWASPAGSGNTTSTTLTTNRVPKANGANSIIDSLLSDDGTTATYTGTGGISGAKVAATGANGGFDGTEGTGAGLTAAAGHDLLYPDSTAHRWKMNNNNGGAVNVVASGVDINSSDQVTATHLAAALPVAQGGTNLTAATDDNVMVGNGTTWQSKALTTCTDTGGNHLNYDASTNTFSCGTSSSGGGGGIGSIISVTFPNGLNTFTASTTFFCMPNSFNTSSCASANGGLYNIHAPAACTLKNLFVELSGTQDASGSEIVRVRKNNSDTGAVSVTFTSADGANPVKSNTATTLAVAQGDSIGVTVVNGATVAGAAIVRITFQCA